MTRDPAQCVSWIIRVTKAVTIPMTVRAGKRVHSPQCAAKSRIDPGGIAAISRWLSASETTGSASFRQTTPAGSQPGDRTSHRFDKLVNPMTGNRISGKRIKHSGA